MARDDVLEQYTQVSLQLAAVAEQLREDELRARGEHPEQLRPYFEAVLAGVALLVVLPAILLVLVTVFG